MRNQPFVHRVVFITSRWDSSGGQRFAIQMPRFAPQPFYRPKPSLLVRLPIQITPPPYLSNRSLCEWAYRNHHDLNPVLHTQPTDGTQFSDEEDVGEKEAQQQIQPSPQPLPTPFSPHPATPTSNVLLHE